MTIALLILVALIVIGFVRFSSQKNKEAKEESSQSQEEIPSSYQTTQEMDESYYGETFKTALAEEETVLETEPPAKKTTAPKKTLAKKTTEKKTAGKKTSAKKSTSKKSSK